MSRLAAAAVAALALHLGAADAEPVLTAADLTGVWRGYETTGPLIIGAEVIFFPEGSYQKSAVLGELMAWQSGQFQVQGNWVHFVPQDYEPKELLGVSQYPPPSETWVVSGFDGARVEGSIGQTSLIYERVQ